MWSGAAYYLYLEFHMKRPSFFLAAAAAFVASCNCDFDLVTTIGEDGSVTREIVCPADSAFLCGNSAMNMDPFDSGVLPVKITEDWTLTWQVKGEEEEHTWPLNSADYHFADDTVLIHARRHFDSVEQMNGQFHFDIVPVSPISGFEKKFRWFYTSYTFRDTFPQPSFPVPVTDYMTSEEATLWFVGGEEEGSSGSVMYERLNGIEKKARKWMYANYLSEAFQYVADHYDELGDTPLSLQEFISERDSFISTETAESADVPEIEAKSLCDDFSRYFGTDIFSGCIREGEETFQSDVWATFVNYSFEYSVKLPGSPIRTCRLNLGMIYPGDYTVTTVSRSINVWAWALTGLALLAAAVLVCREKFQSPC